MNRQSSFELVNPDNKNIAFKVFTFEDDTSFIEFQRLPAYSILLITDGMGTLESDVSSGSFHDNVLMCFSPYQPYSISANGSLHGYGIHFHSDFLCVYKHHQEVACNGVLFDAPYHHPLLPLHEDEADALKNQIEQMLQEMQHDGLAQHEMLISYLKVFLITATRIRLNRSPEVRETLAKEDEPLILQKLKDAIEDNFRTKHAPGEYADFLNISTKFLARLTKKHFNKTPGNLIAERIIIEAKRELYLTSKTVKEIGYELGFHDEHYFSRYFKTNAAVSPQVYRQTVGFAKAETRD